MPCRTKAGDGWCSTNRIRKWCGNNGTGRAWQETEDLIHVSWIISIGNRSFTWRNIRFNVSSCAMDSSTGYRNKRRKEQKISSTKMWKSVKCPFAVRETISSSKPLGCFFDVCNYSESQIERTWFLDWRRKGSCPGNFHKKVNRIFLDESIEENENTFRKRMKTQWTFCLHCKYSP